MNWEMVGALIGAVGVFGGWVIWSLRQLRKNELVHITEQLHILTSEMYDIKHDMKSHIQWHLTQHD